jgi:fumarate reductase subunit D
MSSLEQRLRTAGHRRDLFWVAAMVHRVSGLLLACFLPIHFLVLGLALQQTAALDSFLKWTDLPAVKAAEGVLILLLTVHLLGGVRVLLIENLTWRPDQKGLTIAAFGAAGMVAMIFLLRAL